MDPAALGALARHATAVATARDFAARAGAERVVLVLDAEDIPEGVMVECDGDGAVVLTEGEARHAIPVEAAVPAVPRPLPELRPVPASAVTVDPATGELAAPLGAVQHLGDVVLALAQALGGRTVATADFPTRDPELPITIAAREGEPTVLAVGEDAFLL